MPSLFILKEDTFVCFCSATTVYFLRGIFFSSPLHHSSTLHYWTELIVLAVSCRQMNILMMFRRRCLLLPLLNITYSIRGRFRRCTWMRSTVPIICGCNATLNVVHIFVVEFSGRLGKLVLFVRYLFRSPYNARSDTLSSLFDWCFSARSLWFCFHWSLYHSWYDFFFGAICSLKAADTVSIWISVLKCKDCCG